MPSRDNVTYHVGPSDLRLLGIAAALAARWHTLHTSGQTADSSDAEAFRKLMSGFSEGVRMPLDDVPYINVTVDTDGWTFQRLREIAPPDLASGGTGASQR
jgi:hypothetical protein